MAEVRMPKLSDTMEEGTVLRWLKQPGERVEPGEMLLEVETDKADMEVEATVGGVLREVRLAEGESGRVGDVIAVIGEAEEVPESEGGSSQGGEEAETTASNAADHATRRRNDELRPALAEPSAAASAGSREPAGEGEAEGRGAAGIESETATEEGSPRAAVRSPLGQRAKARVSPLARSLAVELGVDPESIQGTGPGGRVVRRDIEAAAGKAPAPSPLPPEGLAPTHAQASPPAPASAAPLRSPAQGRPVVRPAAREPAAVAVAPPAQGMRRVPLTPMRASIARRMTESKREAPHFYLTSVADMDAAVALRQAMRESATAAQGVTYNHMIVKAVADSLRRFEDLNARFAGDAVEILAGIHVGIATALPDGLIVPVIHDADRLSLLEIADAAQTLAEKARARSFGKDDLSGATFTISNLGMYDVDSFAAVINPPQAAILAVGSVQQRPFVRSGTLVAAHTVSLTLSCDHRAVDGARGAAFLRDVKERLENPLRLLFPAAGEAAD